ncbi:MAG: intracellular growth attenuator family protein [Candidatus Polarisedimenticolaceae bacterium]|nr:intracellular growth attenuator family protein [Candidatus Polarisedimenticolaceae bacterium]
MKAVQLTKAQRYWKKHVMAGLQSGSTMQSYADQQDFNVKTLYVHGVNYFVRSASIILAGLLMWFFGLISPLLVMARGD